MSNDQFAIDCVKQLYAQDEEIAKLRKRLSALSKAATNLLHEVHGFNDGCDCCAMRNAEDLSEYKKLAKLAAESI